MNVESRVKWIKKNSYYYKDLKMFFSFHVEKNSSVIEIGSGVGHILSACSPSLGVALDLDENSCKEAKKLFPQYVIESWNGETPLPDTILGNYPDGIDYILLVNAAGHWSDIQKTLSYLKPLCHPDTRVIATYYNFLWAPVFRMAQKLGLKEKQQDLNWLSKDDLENLLRVSGYRTLKSGYRCLIPKNLGLVSSLLNRFLAPIPLFNWMCCTNYVIARPPHKIPKKDIFASIVIPARNEMGNIEVALRRMSAVKSGREEKYEIIFIEGNSTDNTWDEIQRVIGDPSILKPGPVRAFKQAGAGKGDAVRLGFSKAEGNLLVILDADLTVPPEDLTKFIDVYSDGHGEFINGSRLVYKMEKEAMRPLNLLGNKFFGLAFSWLLNQRFKDTLCGTKVVGRENYQRISKGREYFGDFDPFGDFDLIFGASKLDLEIAEVPIRYRERVYGKTNISRWKHGWLLLKMCITAMGKIKFVP